MYTHVHHNDVYVSTETASSFTHHNARSHMYPVNFGLARDEISKAFQILSSEGAEGDTTLTHLRTVAYDIARHCTHDDLSAWQNISDAIMRDFSTAEHMDHTIAALHMFEVLPNQILLDIATDPDIGGRMISILEHQAPEIRLAAVRCLSGTWLRVWLSLAAGDLRRRPFDEENDDSESIVRQHTCDRVVSVWKAIVALCTSDDDDAVSAAAFRSMEVLFDAGCVPRHTLVSSPALQRPQPGALELTLRVFKTIGGRVYSLAARMRSLSGHHLAQSVLGMTSFYVLGICSGSTVRVEGSAKDVDPADLAQTFVQTMLLPLLCSNDPEVQIASAISTLRLASRIGDVGLQRRWLATVTTHVLHSIAVTKFVAPDIVCEILLECLSFRLGSADGGIGVDLSVQTYIALCSFDVSNVISRSLSRSRLLQKANESMICLLLVSWAQADDTTNDSRGTVAMDQILQNDWMRCVIQGTLNAPIVVCHDILFYFVTEMQKRLASEADDNNFTVDQHQQHRISLQFLRACAPCLCWWEDNERGSSTSGATKRRDAAHAYLSLLADTCARLRLNARRTSQSHESSGDDSLGGSRLRFLATKDDDDSQEQEEDEDNEEEEEEEEEVLLDELFEWHLPNIRRNSIRVSLIHLLCTYWSCDGDPGDADLMVSMLSDALYDARTRNESDPNSSNILLDERGSSVIKSSVPQRRMMTGDSVKSSSSLGSSSGEASHWRMISGSELTSSSSSHRATNSENETLVERARILLPSIVLFATRNSVAKDAVKRLLTKVESTRNKLLRSMALQEQGCVEATSDLISQLLFEIDQKGDVGAYKNKGSNGGSGSGSGSGICGSVTESQVFEYRTLTSSADPIRVDACHTTTTTTVAARSGSNRRPTISSSFSLRVRLFNMTNVPVNNIRICLNTTGCIGSSINGDGGVLGPASGHLFRGWLPSGGDVEWESPTFAASRFGPFAFHIMVSVPNILPNENIQLWPDPLYPLDAMKMVEAHCSYGDNESLVFECSPYDVELQDLFRPIPLSFCEYNTMWTAASESSMHCYVLNGVLAGRNADNFLSSFTETYFAAIQQHPTRDSSARGSSTPPLESTGHATQSISDGSILLMNVEIAKNRNSSTLNDSTAHVKFEFRSKNKDVVQQLQIHMEQCMWLRTIDLNIVQKHSHTARKNIHLETLKQVKRML